MAREEEEKEEAMCLTYDRPEMINKVVFRRNKNTGTWEVFVPNASSPEKASQSNVVNRKNKREGINPATPLRVSPRLNLSEINKVQQVDCHTPLLRGNHSNRLPGKLEDPDYSPDTIRRRQTNSSVYNNITDVTDGSPELSPMKSVTPSNKCIETVSPSSNETMMLRSRTGYTPTTPVHCNINDAISLDNHVNTSPNH